MAIFELTKNEISGLRETTFSEIGIREREDLQRLLREKIEKFHRIHSSFQKSFATGTTQLVESTYWE